MAIANPTKETQTPEKDPKMIPTRKTVVQFNNAYASNVDIWGTGITTLLHMQLIQSNFVPSAELSLADVTLATFDGSDPIAIPVAGQNIIVDSPSGRVGILLKEPAGGYKWICSGLTDLPQTIYGHCITDDADADHILWSGLLPAPIVISEETNFVEISALLGYQVIPPYGDLDA